MIKAVAEPRGLRHASHRDLVNVARLLSDELGEPQLSTQFKASEALHANFYEDFMEPAEVGRRIAEARLLIARLQQLQDEGVRG
jgi:hypothetical protein